MALLDFASLSWSHTGVLALALDRREGCCPFCPWPRWLTCLPRMVPSRQSGWYRSQ